ncbi:hypothetical protein L209DRAFT_751150 [Thermothelomyces heterothallicus CBS 203.75]
MYCVVITATEALRSCPVPSVLDDRLAQRTITLRQCATFKCPIVTCRPGVAGRVVLEGRISNV